MSLVRHTATIRAIRRHVFHRTAQLLSQVEGSKHVWSAGYWRAIAMRPLSADASASSTSEAKNQLPPDFIEDISPIEGVHMDTNKYELERHGRGESYHQTCPPSAVVIPDSTVSTAEIVKACATHRVPIIPFGVGTSLEGHVAALQGGISLDTCKLNKIEFGAETQGMDSSGTDQSSGDNMLSDFNVTVGAGVTRLALNEALRHTGLQFMVDPGADATIGGMLATGASGTTTVKYGTIRENILALEVVLPDGTVAHCGSLARKSSAGYDLKSLMCGSEGTLGIITKVTVKLHPIPSYVASTVCSFNCLHDAAEAVASLMQMGIPLVRCELLDAKSIDAFNRYSSDVAEMPLKPHLFLEFSGASNASMVEQASLSEAICVDDFGASSFELQTKEEERRHLWAARHQLYYASIALRPGAGKAFITDACVPLSRFADLLQATSDDVDELGVVATCFGHAGDGNFHCILPIVPDDSPEYMDKVMEVNHRLIHRTLAVGGTCTGEHGVGYGKMEYLPLQYGDGAVKMMASLKKAIDPLNIMNPGKIVEV